MFSFLEILMIPVSLLLVGSIFVYLAVRRINQKLDPGKSPSFWTYINELGGYFVVGLLILIGGIVQLLNVLIRRLIG